MSTGPGRNSRPLRWIPRLIKAHALVDGGTRLALRQESALRGQDTESATPCGSKPCGTACHQRNVSVTAVELAGALWHLNRNAADDVRQDVLARLGEPSGQIPSGGCPFALHDACTVYPLRFMACRQFSVTGFKGHSGLADGRGLSPILRLGALITPLRQFTLRAFSLLLPFYGISGTLHDPLYLEALLRELSAPVNSWSVTDPAQLLDDVENARLRPRTLAA